MSTSPGRSSPASGRRDAGALTVGTLLSGMAAYAFIAVGTRAVGAEGFAPVSILWTLWAATAAFITFPVQHWAVRTIETDGHEGGVRRALPTLGGVAVVLGVVLAAVVWPLRQEVFGTDAPTFPVLTGLLPLGSVAMGLNRGVLCGRHRFGETGVAIFGENFLRLVAAGVVVVIDGGPTALGIGIVCGFAVAAVWPSSFAPGRDEQPHPRTELVSPLAFLSGIAGGSLAAQLILTSGPLLLAGMGGTPSQVTGLFAALALARAPYMVSTGIAPRITSTVTVWVVEGREDRLERLRTLVALGTGLGGLAAAGAAWLVGGDAMRIAFGAGTSLAPNLLAGVAFGASLAIGALLLTLMLIARGATSSVTTVWLAGTVAGAVVLVLSPGEPLTRVVAATVAAQLVAATLLWLVDLNEARNEEVRGPVLVDERPPS